MCGITGFISLNQVPPDQRLVREMTNRTRHRGPDGEGFYTDSKACLGHRRLSLVAPSCGHQPLSDPESRFWVTANAEVHNYR